MLTTYGAAASHWSTERVQHEYEKFVRLLSSAGHERRAARAQADIDSAQIAARQAEIDALGVDSIRFAMDNGTYPNANSPYTYVYDLEREEQLIEANTRYLGQLVEQRL